MSLVREESGGVQDPANRNPIELPAFHKIVSEQLNARLSESPKFFAALVIAGSAYGYALWLAWESSTKATEFLLASILAYAAVVWSLWYLAALGYAFRLLQNTQHCIERALRWDRYTPSNNEPPCHIQTAADVFWLLPGIYHAHTFGLVAFLVIIGIAFIAGYTPGPFRWILGGGALVGGLLFAAGINVHYVRKFRRRRRHLEEVEGENGHDVLPENSATGWARIWA